MKYGLLAILVPMILIATLAGAEESKRPYESPGGRTLFLLAGAASPTLIPGPSVKSFEEDTGGLKFLKFFSKAECGFEPETCFHSSELPPRPPLLVTRIKLFHRQIFLTFSIGG